jgi:hypothetical protein
MRIQCPKCGSSAQVRLMWSDTDGYGTEYTREYECGCGCAFEATYEVRAVKILEDAPC